VNVLISFSLTWLKKEGPTHASLLEMGRLYDFIIFSRVRAV